MYSKNLFKGFHPNPNGTESIILQNETIKGNWVTGGYHEHLKREVCFAEDKRDDDIGHLIVISGLADWNMPKPLTAFEVIPETVCQFTGLKTYWSDEEIPYEADVWERDLLEVEYEGKKVIAEVRYEAGMFVLVSSDFANYCMPLFAVVIREDDYWVQAKKVGNVFIAFNCQEAPYAKM